MWVGGSNCCVPSEFWVDTPKKGTYHRKSASSLGSMPRCAACANTASRKARASSSSSSSSLGALAGLGPLGNDDVAAVAGIVCLLLRFEVGVCLGQ